ncbi:MAG: HAD-IIA family hydrolase [Frankiaceae bacterium]
MTGGRRAGGWRASREPLAQAYDAALLDLDGVVYLGSRAIDGAAAVVGAVEERGMRVAYVTNNASRTPEAVAERLVAMGLPATAADVVTSAQAAARVLVQRFGTGATVLPIGGEGLRAALREAGCTLVASADDRPAAVAQGYAPDLAYADLAEAAVAVARGAWWIATNGDLTVPGERGLQPGNGALVGAVAAAVGHGPAAFAGKPEPALLAEAVRRIGAACPLMVGDRLDTDIEGAVRGGVDSLLVLTGVSTGAELILAPPERRPCYVGAGLDALLDRHEAPLPDGDGWSCGGWRAVARGAEILVSGPPGEGRPVDLLRVTAAAAWAAADAGRPVRQVQLPAAHAPTARAVRLDGLLPAAGGPVG